MVKRANEIINHPVFRDFDANSSEARALSQLFCCSDFCLRVAEKSPEYIHQLFLEDLSLARSKLDYVDELGKQVFDKTDEQNISEILRQFRNQEMLRIAWRELVVKADVEVVLRELSDLADTIIEIVLQKFNDLCVTEFGQPVDSDGEPVKLVVLAMGKLGAHELNFSSDIDLIFCFKEEGVIEGRKALSHQQFFSRLCQRIIRVLDETTAYGFVYRVDARLRPFGDSGHLALSFDAMESYYERHGREWERYAMIKARPISEDSQASEEIMKRLKPFIYRRYLDFSAFESLREMKALIETDLKRKGAVDNIKLGPGGIREIEFIGQAFQLIRGGRTKELQMRGILDILAMLELLDLVPKHVCQELKDNYLFFRRVENTIQAYDDKQTHSLPSQNLHQERLCYSLDYENWSALVSDVQSRMTSVHEVFEQIFSAPQLQIFGDDGDSTSLLVNRLWKGEVANDEATEVLKKIGFSDVNIPLNLLNGFRKSSHYKSTSLKGRQRIDKLMPLIILRVSQSQEPNKSLLRLITLMEAIARRSAYIALLAEHPMGLSQLVNLVEKSEWISNALVRSPILLDELLDPRRLVEPIVKSDLEQELLTQMPADDLNLEQQMQVLCEFKESNMFRVAASELIGALPVNKISDHLTFLAEVVVSEVERISLAYVMKKYGPPQYYLENKLNEANFCIVAYGKLGSYELGFGSDVDVVFLHDSEGEKQYTAGEKSVENGLFFARVAQRIMHILNTRSQYGILYEVDTRLRPSGGAGILVSNLNSFADYQHNKAWTWEHQALIRARVITGNSKISERFTQIRSEVLRKSRNIDELRTEVRKMRMKIRQELYKRRANYFNLKQSVGGITDIEFIIQYLTLAWASKYPDIILYTDNLRIIQVLVKNAILSEEDAKILSHAYLAFREKSHKNTLQGQSLDIELTEEFSLHQQGVEKLWQKFMEQNE